MYDPRAGLTVVSADSNFFYPLDTLKRDDSTGNENKYIVAHNDNLVTYAMNVSNVGLGAVSERTTLRIAYDGENYFFDVYNSGLVFGVYPYENNIKEIVQSFMRDLSRTRTLSSSSYYVNIENEQQIEIDIYVIVYDEDITSYQEYSLITGLRFVSGYFQNRKNELNILLSDKSEGHTALTNFTRDATSFLSNVDEIKVWNGYPYIAYALSNKTFDEYALYVDNVELERKSISSSQDMFSILVNDGTNAGMSLSSIIGKHTATLWTFNANSYVNRKILKFNVVEPCTNGIYLRWRNSLGVWSFFLFSNVYYVSKKAKNKGDYYKSLTNDLISNEARRNTIYKTNDVTITAGAILTNEDISYVEDLFTSAEVFLYTASQYSGLGLSESDYGYYWEKVKIADSSEELFYSKKRNKELSIDIILDEQYNHFK